jgi:hypothetical protein
MNDYAFGQKKKALSYLNIVGCDIVVKIGNEQFRCAINTANALCAAATAGAKSIRIVFVEIVFPTASRCVRSARL